MTKAPSTAPVHTDAIASEQFGHRLPIFFERVIMLTIRPDGIYIIAIK